MLLLDIFATLFIPGCKSDRRDLIAAFDYIVPRSKAAGSNQPSFLFDK